MRHKKTYHDMETSRADMTDFRRPPYAVQRAIRVQAEQIRHKTADEYIKDDRRKINIGSRH